jgi:AcrR family transcriptional regulator
MSSQSPIAPGILADLEASGFVTRTFARLDEARRGAVLAAIFEEASKAGPDRILIKDVAARSGVPVGSLYQYFGNRENLARCATLFVAQKLVGDLEAWTPYLADMPLREALSAYLRSGLEWGSAEAASLRSFVAVAYGSAPRRSPLDAMRDTGRGVGGEAGGSGGSGDDEWTRKTLVGPVAAALQGMVRAVFLAAERRGELREGLDAEVASRLAGALLIAVGDSIFMPGLDSYYRLFDREHGADGMIDQVVDFIVRSVGPERG